MIALTVSTFSGCGNDVDTSAVSQTDSKPAVTSVYVVNYPLQYFADRIGGQHVRVVFPAPDDVDPAYWRPDTETIAQYQQADLILLSGARYAKWVELVSLPESRKVDTSIAVMDEYIRVQNAVTHSHGPGKVHAHGGLASTIWLDPNLAIAQANAIMQALIKSNPVHEQDFRAGFQMLAADLQDLDAQLAAAVQRDTSCPIMFSHPVFQYLQRRYALNSRTVTWETDRAPTKKMVDDLAAVLADHKAQVMVWEAAPTAANVRQIERLGLRSTVFDICAGVPDEGDYLTVMRRNVDNLAAALSGEQT